MSRGNNKYLKFAFTMAEVLLTLVILGVVVALMLRSINRINPDKDKVLFLRAFHAIEMAAADVINDTSYYAPDIATASDFSTDPMPTTKVELYSSGSKGVYCSKKSQYAVTDCNKVIDQSNAMCYLIAEKLSTDGKVNCNGGSAVMNFKLGNGTCIYGLAGNSTTFPHEFAIDPGCDGVFEAYAAMIDKTGNVTVSDKTTLYSDFFNDEDRQKKVYRWVNEQTDVKKKEYDFSSSSGDSTSE